MYFLCSLDLLLSEKEASDYHDVCVSLSAVFSLMRPLQFFYFAHFHFQPDLAVAQGCQPMTVSHIIYLHHFFLKLVAFICSASDTP